MKPCWPTFTYVNNCLSMCLSVCLSVREHISVTAGPIHTKSSLQMPCGRGSVLVRRRCAALCTSGIMDDVTYSDECHGDTGVESDVCECKLDISDVARQISSKYNTIHATFS